MYSHHYNSVLEPSGIQEAPHTCSKSLFPFSAYITIILLFVSIDFPIVDTLYK